MNTKNLTKQQIKELEAIRANLRRAVRYMRRPEVQGIAEVLPESRALGCDYRIINPACCETATNLKPIVRTMDHRAGSDFVGLYNALTAIESFLAPPQTEEQTTE